LILIELKLYRKAEKQNILAENKENKENTANHVAVYDFMK